MTKMNMKNVVVLVDNHGYDLFDEDGRLSLMEKVEAHQRGVLHRAVSVFLFNDRNEFLLQKRVNMKYHSPGKWANTCCTHPLPGETPLNSAQRRLNEEMGLITPLTEMFTFLYQADVCNGLIENEFDHVFFGLTDCNPQPDPFEVSDWAWIEREKLKEDILSNPEQYGIWFRLCFDKVIKYKL